ncbi:hypothetical protein [Variovorax sp. EL159]|uniref:hypothetical protein n=1 Tax=Variovorax sp. EL159 TaxID=1566270 RepID=UPI0015A4B184|nr:hypothetical protein [Variovorax sp. EL159]
MTLNQTPPLPLDYRCAFEKLGDNCLMAIDELAGILPDVRTSMSWRKIVLKRVRAGRLPAPVCKTTRGQLWRVSDVRAWVQGLQVSQTERRVAPVKAKAESASGRRPGRPRKTEKEASA